MTMQSAGLRSPALSDFKGSFALVRTPSLYVPDVVKKITHKQLEGPFT